MLNLLIWLQANLQIILHLDKMQDFSQNSQVGENSKNRERNFFSSLMLLDNVVFQPIAHLVGIDPLVTIDAQFQTKHHIYNTLRGKERIERSRIPPSGLRITVSISRLTMRERK